MRRRGCSGGMVAEAAGDEAGATVAVAAGWLGVRRFLRASSNLRCISAFSSADGVCGEDSVTVADGEGLSTGGDGRTLTVGDADAAGDGVAAGAVVAAGVGVLCGAAVALEIGDAEAEGEGDGRVLTVADGEDAGEAAAVA